MRKELINKLGLMQMWRRGANMDMPCTPREFGFMIDDCIRILRKLTDEQVNEILYGREQRDR